MFRIPFVLLITALLAVACATTKQEPPPVAEGPIAQPEPAPAPVVRPSEPVERVELPKTASPMPLVGLTGLGAVGLAGAMRVIRRRL